MPSSRPRRRLEDIVANARSIIDDVRGLSEVDCLADRLLQDAVLYRLLRISEAAKKLGPAAESMMPEQPRTQIRAFGNAMRHDYDEIRLDQVWIIVLRDIPVLLAAVERSLRDLQA